MVLKYRKWNLRKSASALVAPLENREGKEKLPRNFTVQLGATARSSYSYFSFVTVNATLTIRVSKFDLLLPDQHHFRHNILSMD